jgi:hypothetical protein
MADPWAFWPICQQINTAGCAGGFLLQQEFLTQDLFLEDSTPKFGANINYY